MGVFLLQNGPEAAVGDGRVVPHANAWVRNSRNRSQNLTKASLNYGLVYPKIQNDVRK